MPVPSFPSLATLALLAGAVGCASTTVRTDDSPSAAARDTTTTTTTAADTAAVQNPTGYRGMERDTTLVGVMDTTQAASGDTTIAR